jgi:S-phase kinase-associated protein 1
MADDNDMIKLVSKDGSEVEIEYKYIKKAETIKNLVEDAGTVDSIPLPEVTGITLRKIVEYLIYHANHPDAPAPIGEQVVTEQVINPNTGWDSEFIKVDQALLFELILGANYLDIKGLLDLTCKTVANMIKGKTPEEIRTIFNIENDFTPEEEEQVRRENEWAEEK